MGRSNSISIHAYQRITRYLNYLTKLSSDTEKYISATSISDALKINDVVVRKDLAAVSGNGKPKVGYIRQELIIDIEHFLGYDNCTDSVLVGVGHLGTALLHYQNFEKYGLNIVAAFDNSPALIGSSIAGKKVFACSKLVDLCKRLHIKVGIITVPEDAAQNIANCLVDGGTKAIWNFAPCELKVPEEISVKNEDMAASLAILTKHLTAKRVLQEHKRG